MSDNLEDCVVETPVPSSVLSRILDQLDKVAGELQDRVQVLEREVIALKDEAGAHTHSVAQSVTYPAAFSRDPR